MKASCIVRILFPVLFAINVSQAAAQHCRYDGSIVLVLDVKNSDTGQPVPGLAIKLVDKDSLEYWRTSYTYTSKLKYPSYRSEYLEFVFVTQELIDEVKRETNRDLPASVINKYILWLGPQVYRSVYGVNLERKAYLKDMVKFNFKESGLIRSFRHFALTEKMFFQGCTATKIWKDNPEFQTLSFTTEEISRLEKPYSVKN